MKTYRCWCPTLGEPLRSGEREVEALDEEHAAEKFMIEWFDPAEDAWHPYDVVVQDADDPEAPTTIVEVEPEPDVVFQTYTADLVARRER